MLKLKETDKLTEFAQKIEEIHALKIKAIENEIAQLTESLIQGGVLLESTDSNCLKQENLIDYCNSKLS